MRRNDASIDGDFAMPSKEARSASTASTNNNLKRNLTFAGSAIAVVGLCIGLKLMMGSNSANAQIPNPFRKSKTQEQPAAPVAKKEGPQQATAQMPAGQKP